jgi:hypothetical protein
MRLAGLLGVGAAHNLGAWTNTVYQIRCSFEVKIAGRYVYHNRSLVARGNCIRFAVSLELPRPAPAAKCVANYKSQFAIRRAPAAG